MISAEKRARLAELRREIRDLTSDDKDVQRRARAKARKARQAAIGKPAKGQREPRETDPGFLAYLRRQPCEAAHLGGCSGPIEAAHIRYSDATHGRNPGMQSKNHDRNANPLCREHHQRDQHAGAERAFWSRLGKDAYETAAKHYARYLNPNGKAQ